VYFILIAKYSITKPINKKPPSNPKTNNGNSSPYPLSFAKPNAVVTAPEINSHITPKQPKEFARFPPAGMESINRSLVASRISAFDSYGGAVIW